MSRKVEPAQYLSAPAATWYMARSVVGTGLLFGLVGAVLPGVTAKGSAQVGAALGAAGGVWALWTGKTTR